VTLRGVIALRYPLRVFATAASPAGPCGVIAGLSFEDLTSPPLIEAPREKAGGHHLAR
jgi:hypothetical protein